MQVSNRDFSRNYKMLRDQLIRGQIDEIVVPQKSGAILKIIAVTEETSATRWLKKIKKMKPLIIQRPEDDLFDL
jgi:hypothetical protein